MFRSHDIVGARERGCRAGGGGDPGLQHGQLLRGLGLHQVVLHRGLLVQDFVLQRDHARWADAFGLAVDHIAQMHGLI